MEFASGERAEGTGCVFLYGGCEFCWKARSVEARQRKVRGKRAVFQGKAELVEGLVDVGGERFQIGRGLSAERENSRALLVGEETKAAEAESDGVIRGNACHVGVEAGQ